MLVSPNSFNAVILLDINQEWRWPRPQKQILLFKTHHLPVLKSPIRPIFKIVEPDLVTMTYSYLTKKGQNSKGEFGLRLSKL